MQVSERVKKDAAYRQVERVLVVDDDPRVRTMLNIILSRENHVVVGMASNGSQAIQAMGTCAPSLMLLDLDMPCMEGLATLRELRQRYPWLPVLVLSMLDPNIYALRCARLGARGFLNKGEHAPLLPEMIEQMRRGVMLFPSQMTEGELPFSALSDRELIALRSLVRGGDANSIATTLMVSQETANKLRRRLFTKLGLATDEALIQAGRDLRLC